MKKSFLVFLFVFVIFSLNFSSFSFAQSPLDKDRAKDREESEREQAAKRHLTEEEVKELRKEIEKKKKENSLLYKTARGAGTGLNSAGGAVKVFFYSLFAGEEEDGGVGTEPEKNKTEKGKEPKNEEKESRFWLLFKTTQFVTNSPTIFDFLMACLKGGAVVIGFYWLIRFINFLSGKNPYLGTGIAIVLVLTAGWFLMGNKAFSLNLLPVLMNFIGPEIKSEKTRYWLTFSVFFLTILVIGYF